MMRARRPRVLIVDDDVIARLLAREALERSGWLVHEADNGRLGLTFDELKRRKGWYDPTVLDALKVAFTNDIKYEVKTAVVADLRHGMILGGDI